MRITDPRVQALLAAVCAFKLLPDGFTNRDLRHQLAPLLGQRFLIPGMAQVTGPSPPADSTLRTAARAYEAAIDDLARHAGLAA